MDRSCADHLADIENRGWTLIPGVFDDETIDGVLADYDAHEHVFREVQDRKGLTDLVANATHHTVVVCRRMLDLLMPGPHQDVVRAWFDGPFILNTMGLSVVPPDGHVYTQSIHRDVRSNTGNARLWINTLVMLDDSTADNGATLMLEGSQQDADRPDPARFAAEAVRATGRRGDVLVFDGNIWHAAGENRTDAPRRIITPIYSRPFIKQQLDYPRAFGYDFAATIDSHLRQVLGYNARVPVTLDDFYQHDEGRFYQRDQG